MNANEKHLPTYHSFCCRFIPFISVSYHTTNSSKQESDLLLFASLLFIPCLECNWKVVRRWPLTIVRWLTGTLGITVRNRKMSYYQVELPSEILSPAPLSPTQQIEGISWDKPTAKHKYKVWNYLWKKELFFFYL